MDDVRERLETALADRYRIEGELGRGGMATVYRAHDLRHDRTVALKVLKPDLAAAVGSERFLREIRITARLNHPHVLPLLDSGEAAGLLFYVLPFAPQGSLRQRLNDRRIRSLEETLRIAEQAATALHHAHRNGIVHRDVKPENILFVEGLAVVADFGIAKAIASAGGAALTQSGIPLGTPGYMSPEQAAGRAELDERTDVFGLACVVYEMLVGETPGLWPSDEALRVGRLLDASPAHRARLDALPGRAEQVLVKALAMRPGDRYEGPLAFAAALTIAAKGSPKVSDEQVQAILRRAAEKELDEARGESQLSIGGVEQIAAEVGIPPGQVQRAVEDVVRAPGPLPGERVGAPAVLDRKKERLLLDRVVDGEITPHAHAALVDLVQRSTGIAGHVSVLGNALTWSPAAPGTEERKLVVTVTAQGGRTRLHIEERFEVAGWKMFIPAWGAAGGAVLGFGLGAVLGLPHPEIVIPAVIGAFGGGITTGMALTRVPAARRRRGLETLADALAAEIERHAPPALEDPTRPAT